jgi:hypothetical protein
VEVGDHVVVADYHMWDYTIRVYRIVKIMDKEAILVLVAEFEHGVWNPPLPSELEKAVEAAKLKSQCYHCREPHYVLK